MEKLGCEMDNEMSQDIEEYDELSEDVGFVPPLDLGMTPDLLQQIMDAKRGDPNKFQSFWEMDEEGVDEDTMEEIEKSPEKKMLWAAENDKMEVVKEMLDGNSDLIKTKDGDGYTALHRASYNGHAQMAQYLIEQGADIKAITIDGWMPLHSASRWDQSDVVSLLLQHGSDINAQTNSGQTALHLASYEHCRNCLQILLMNKDCDVTIKNKLGETAYQICARTSDSCALFEVRDENINKL